MRRVVFLGGNGHTSARLARAHRALADAGRPFDLVEVPYPGFDGRPRAADLEGFLSTVAGWLAEPLRSPDPTLLYGTGIGGLLALAVRARGGAGRAPLILQAPVLWGLEKRLMPRLVRRPPLRWLLPFLFASSAFRGRFVAAHFQQPLSPEEVGAFFLGYERCSALADLFSWVDGTFLRGIEEAARRDPTILGSIRLFWGGLDRVIPGDAEVAWTESALGVRWPLRSFPSWGHYPMIDDPTGWIAAIDAELHGVRPPQG